MVFSYSTDEPTTVHKVRLVLSDSNEKDAKGNTVYIFHDEELQFFLDQNRDNIWGAAADAIMARIADLARVFTYKFGRAGAGAVEVSVADARASLMALAKGYRERANSEQATEIHDWSLQDLEDLEVGILGRTYDSDYEERQETTFDD